MLPSPQLPGATAAPLSSQARAVPHGHAWFGKYEAERPRRRVRPGDARQHRQGALLLGLSETCIGLARRVAPG